MPRKQVTTYTWACDGLNCPTPPSSAEANPFITVRVHKPGKEGVVPIEVDLCDACIGTVTAPAVVAAVGLMLEEAEE